MLCQTKAVIFSLQLLYSCKLPRRSIRINQQVNLDSCFKDLTTIAFEIFTWKLLPERDGFFPILLREGFRFNRSKFPTQRCFWHRRVRLHRGYRLFLCVLCCILGDCWGCLWPCQILQYLIISQSECNSLCSSICPRVSSFQKANMYST